MENSAIAIILSHCISGCDDFKVRHEGVYSTRAFYTVYSVDWAGNRDLLGLYINQRVRSPQLGIGITRPEKASVEDILVICTDNLKGFSQTIQEEYPRVYSFKMYSPPSKKFNEICGR
ncbi:MAG: transposase [Saprospiraceae bacterium]